MNFNDFLGNKREYYYGKITHMSPKAQGFLKEYGKEARKYGTVLENGIPNPIMTNIQYCNRIVSPDFHNDAKYIRAEMKKLLEGANSGALTFLSESIYQEFCILKQNGKNDNVLRNTFIKFMCWFKFDFQNTMYYLNSPFPPKILYYGNVKMYESLFLKILHRAGCFIIVVNTGESTPELNEIPEISQDGFTITSPLPPSQQPTPPKPAQPQTQPRPAQTQPRPAPFQPGNPAPSPFMPSHSTPGRKSTAKSASDIKMKTRWHSCTNVWASSVTMDNILKESRGTESNVYYNCFIQVNGVNSKADYLGNLIQMYKSIKKRNHVIVDKEILPPDNREMNRFAVQSNENVYAVIDELAAFLPTNNDMNRQIRAVFIDFMIEEAQRTNANASVIKNTGVHIICYLERYRKTLFDTLGFPDVAVFIFMGAVTNKKTASFLSFLAELPVDVLVLKPDLSAESVLEGKTLIEVNYTDSLVVEKFPNENTRISIGTTAYHAEQEINQIMSEATMAFKSQKAVAVCLRTMYEEIEQLWQEELKFRPSFSADEKSIVAPVIFSKVSGVKDGNVTQYWRDIKRLITEDTFLIKKVPFVKPVTTPQQNWAFMSGSNINREAIKANQLYRFGMLRNEVQEHIFDCMQRLIDSKMMKSTPEHKIISIILNMDMNFINMIQNIDFTKKNPKVVCILTNENAVSEEDAVTIAFLSTAGFDVVFFVPTGYQTAEKFYTDGALNEHQNGEYVYNLSVPDFHVKSANPKLTLKERLFGKK